MRYFYEHREHTNAYYIWDRERGEVIAKCEGKGDAMHITDLLNKNPQ